MSRSRSRLGPKIRRLGLGLDLVKSGKVSVSVLSRSRTSTFRLHPCLELLKVQIFSEFCATSHSWDSRPTSQKTRMTVKTSWASLVSCSHRTSVRHADRQTDRQTERRT